MAKRRQTEEFPKRSHNMPLPQQTKYPLPQQPGNPRRADNMPQATGDGKRPIRESAGSINAPAPDYTPSEPKERPAPVVRDLPPQNPDWVPPPSGSPGSKR